MPRLQRANNPLHADGAPVPRLRSARRPAGERLVVSLAGGPSNE